MDTPVRPDGQHWAEMDRVQDGQTVSATRFAELTGVSRERLRTWERRYGFPEPRGGSGPRRYALADIPRVVAVRPPRRRASRSPGRSAPAPARRRRPPPRFAALVDRRRCRSPRSRARRRCVSSGSTPRCARSRGRRAPARAARRCPPSTTRRASPALSSSSPTALRPVEVDHPAWDGAARQARARRSSACPAEPDARRSSRWSALEGARRARARAALAERGASSRTLRRRAARHAAGSTRSRSSPPNSSTSPGPRSSRRPRRDPPPDRRARRGLASYAPAAWCCRVAPRHARANAVTSPPTRSSARGAARPEPAWLDAPPRAARRARGLHAVGVPVVVAGETLGMLVLRPRRRRAA